MKVEPPRLRHRDLELDPIAARADPLSGEHDVAHLLSEFSATGDPVQRGRYHGSEEEWLVGRLSVHPEQTVLEGEGLAGNQPSEAVIDPHGMSWSGTGPRLPAFQIGEVLGLGNDSWVVSRHHSRQVGGPLGGSRELEALGFLDGHLGRGGARVPAGREDDDGQGGGPEGDAFCEELDDLVKELGNAGHGTLPRNGFTYACEPFIIIHILGYLSTLYGNVHTHMAVSPRMEE